MLGARDLARWTTSADVEQTKPAPDLIEAALEKAGTREAVVVGDTTWDVEAAKRAGVPAIGVLSGGFSGPELSEAGAIEVYDSVMDLHGRIDGSALSG
jgi:phosphoglycolate phosphatase-like HAD superfamily hydrolase